VEQRRPKRGGCKGDVSTALDSSVSGQIVEFTVVSVSDRHGIFIRFHGRSKCWSGTVPLPFLLSNKMGWSLSGSLHHRNCVAAAVVRRFHAVRGAAETLANSARTMARGDRG
jgi:hypothetical protein